MLVTENNLFSSNILAESFAQTIETMAFMMALPPEDNMCAPQESIMVSMDFTGPINGHVELVAGVNLIVNAAANIMGLDEDDPLAKEKGIDAFKEILNTTCGILLPRIAESPNDIFDVTIPCSESFSSVDKWDEYVTQEDVVILELDQNPVAIKMKLTK